MTTKGVPSASSILPVRGDIWRVDFNPTKGDEIKKIRPAVVISSDAFTPLQTKIVLPLTHWQDKFTNAQWMVKIVANTNNGLDHDSAADALQLRCVSYERFVNKLGIVNASILDEISAAIAIVIEFP
jgi:mRNA interferase MazF